MESWIAVRDLAWKYYMSRKYPCGKALKVLFPFTCIYCNDDEGDHGDIVVRICIRVSKLYVMESDQDSVASISQL